jgi:hypothetical protein
VRALKHLPKELWPPQDRALLDAAFAPGDVFDDSGGPGAHLSAATRRGIVGAWRRWLGFLTRHRPTACSLPAAERVTPLLVRDYVEQLRTEISSTSVATAVAQLYDCMRVIAPERTGRG